MSSYLMWHLPMLIHIYIYTTFRGHILHCNLFIKYIFQLLLNTPLFQAVPRKRNCLLISQIYFRNRNMFKVEQTTFYQFAYLKSLKQKLHCPSPSYSESLKSDISFLSWLTFLLLLQTQNIFLMSIDDLWIYKKKKKEGGKERKREKEKLNKFM